MTPKKLTLQGIYSYQDRQVIDFEKLLAGQLFGIFGAVGSGKSTILEAISFALYGKTDRLNARENRNYNMMNLKSNELLIDFEFVTGKKNQEYRFTVTGKRSQKNYEDVRTFARSAYRKNMDGDWEPLESANAENVLDMSYENFHRTIIIPQNKFREFLELGGKDRSQMLKEIFKLEKYDLFYKVRSLEVQNDKEKENIEGGLHQIGEVDENSINLKRTELQEARQELEKCQERHSRKVEQKARQDKIKALHDELSEHKEKLNALLEDAEEYKKKESALKEYKFCQLRFQSMLSRMNELEKEMSSEEKFIADKTAQLTEVKANKEKCAKSFEIVEKSYENIPREKLKSEELAKLQEVQKISRNLEAELKVAAHKQKEYDEKSKQLSDLVDWCERQQKTIDRLSEKMPDDARLNDLHKWYITQTHLHKQLEEAREYQDKLGRDLEKYGLDKDRLINERLASLVKDSVRSLKLKDLIPALEKVINDFTHEITSLRSTEKHLAASQKLEEMAKALEDGKPCPLCGAESHPDILDVQNISEELVRIDEIRTRKERERETLRETRNALNEIRTLAQDKSKSLKAQRQKLKSIEQQYKEHQDNFSWSDYKIDDQEKLKKDLEQSQKVKQKIISESDKLKKNQEQEKRLRDGCETMREELSKLNKEIQQKINRQDVLKSQVTHLDHEKYLEKSAEELRAIADKWHQNIENTEKKYVNLRKDISSLATEISKIEGSLDRSQAQLKKCQESLQKIQEDFDHELEQSDFASRAEIVLILEQKIDTEQEESDILEYNNAVTIAREKVNSIHEKLGGVRFNRESYENLIAEVNQLGEDLEQKKSQKIRLEENLKTLTDSWSAKKKLLEKLDSVQERAENLKTLKRLFQGNGFVNYISSVHLQSLCRAANERFYKLTRQKLRLEITEKNNFQVRDFLNDGRLRSAKTLSGGQTFQASLSLALALSESIQKQHENDQNFFFLDEGFGSQDKEALQIVFQTLKALREEDRVVGVISHVEELQQEIDVFLHIRNDSERGSQISPSWS